MRSSTQQQQQQPRNRSPAEEMGLGPKKTILILCTVIGCIAILFPKIFYPMIFSGTLDANRGPPNLYKQERPPHKDLVHPSMQERGRAIPPHPSVPIVVERPGRPLMPPGNVERRPGGIPGHPGASLRAAAYQAQAQQQQQQQKGGQSMIMPLYTFCIVAFFVFTIVKILLKKTKKEKIEPLEPDPNFTEKVFKQDTKKKLVYTAIQGIIDATNEQLSEIEKDCAEKNIEHNAVRSARAVDSEKMDAELKLEKSMEENDADREAKITDESSDDLLNLSSDDVQESESKNEYRDARSEHDVEIEKRLDHLKEAMHIKSVENAENSDLKSIYLEGELPHDPKIFVSATETETKTEKLSHYPSVKDLVDEDETVILSGKMTISLISLANSDEDKNHGIVEDHTNNVTTNNVA